VLMTGRSKKHVRIIRLEGLRAWISRHDVPTLTLKISALFLRPCRPLLLPRFS
jgi:hypothetical protein